MAATPGKGGLVSLGEVAVAAAGTPVSVLQNFTGLDTEAERITAGWTGKCASILIQAKSDNAGIVYVGNRSDFDPTTGGLNGCLAELAVGASISFGPNDTMNLLNIADFWIDALNNDDAVRVTVIIQ